MAPITHPEPIKIAEAMVLSIVYVLKNPLLLFGDQIGQVSQITTNGVLQRGVRARKFDRRHNN